MGEEWIEAVKGVVRAAQDKLLDVTGPPKFIRELQRVTKSPANYEVSTLDHFVDPLHLENAGPASQIVFGGGGFVMSTLSGNLPAAGVFYDQYNAGIGTWVTGRPQKALLTRAVDKALPNSGPWTKAGAEIVLGGGVGASPKLVSGLASYGDDALSRLFAGSGRTGIQANKLAGDKVRDAIALREAPAVIEHPFVTLGGVRVADVVKLGDEIVEIESKVGRTSLTPRVRQELARDWWLRRQGQVDRVVWEFSPSDVTGKVGPTPQLAEKLKKLEFDVRTNTGQ
jgi:hypothetical protein